VTIALLSVSTGIDWGTMFFAFAAILIAAKVASEVCDRIGVPAVIGEIAVGVAIGPSVLGLVDTSDAIRILAELGVIVLLAQVGLEMNLGELRKVGRAALVVAVIGVAAPMGFGFGAGQILGESTNASLFLGAALAATSVGITARVFGDLRALSTTEARLVLGAAVADDVLGLVILTIVTRVAEQGSVDVAGVLSTLVLAIGFLIASTAIGLVVLPRITTLIGSRAKSPSVIAVFAAAVTFAMASAADAAQLAPIIGAFVAGMSLGGTDHHERISREFNVLATIFVPIFFVSIGLDTDVSTFANGHTLLLAAALSIVAIAAKMIASVGAWGTGADRVLVGLGMVPRGEVGLIFASIGLTVGVFDDDLYAVVLIVVLVTTLVAPPLLRVRLGRTAARVSPGETPEPAGGWLVQHDNRLILQGSPPPDRVLLTSLEAAVRAASLDPGTELLDWAASHRDTALRFDSKSARAFIDVVRRGNARSWRFLDLVGVLDRALPGVASALHARRGDFTELDPTRVMTFPALEHLRQRGMTDRLDTDNLMMAAFLADATDGQQAEIAVELISPLRLSTEDERTIVALLKASTLLRTVVSQEPFTLNTRVLAQLAEYLTSPINVEMCRHLTEARGELEDWQYSALLEVISGVQEVLAHPELIDGTRESVLTLKESKALDLTTDPLLRDRIENASAGYLIAHSPADIVRHAELIEPLPRGRTVRVTVHEIASSEAETQRDSPQTSKPHRWQVEIATRDAKGLLARIAGVFAEYGLEVASADLATWPDGGVVDSFTIVSFTRPSSTQLAHRIQESLKRRPDLDLRVGRTLLKQLVISVDQDAHPWHTVVTVSGADQPGLLQAVATSFSTSGIHVHHASISTSEGIVTDRFEVSDRHGRKIGDKAVAKLMQHFA
jgi:Kef-type K+ transport system membrane component KefB/predicted amino acid-binding ACT domain protein